MPTVDVPAYVIAAAIGIILSFWGVQLSRFIASIVFGSFLAYLTFIEVYRAFHSYALAIIFLFIAFGIGFALGFLFFRASLSILFGYLLARIIINLFVVGEGIALAALLIILTTIFAVLIYMLSKYILAIVFASSGALILFTSLVKLGLEYSVAGVVALIVFVAGLYNQVKNVI
jgi:hypothetical protein